MEYLTTNEAAKKWGVTARMVIYYCVAGRVAGAIKKEKFWLIPSGAEKSKDMRYKDNFVPLTDNQRVIYKGE